MKIALCGLWHVHAGGYYNTAKQYGEVIGVWDENAEWRKAFAEKNGLYEFNSFEELLESDAEGVIVCSATNIHTEVIVKLAEAKKNIFTEKVLALTNEDCAKIAEAIEKNGVKFVISLVHKYSAGHQTAKAIVDSGKLGKLNYLRFRNVHSGSTNNWLPNHFYSLEECGGGAMIDLGAHGMYLTDWFLGLPEKYTSVFNLACTNPETALKNVDKVEDNAITVMSYPDGTIAVNETGFVSNGCPMSLEIGGEQGYLRVVGDDVTVNGEKVELVAGKESPLVQFLTDKIEEGCGINEAKNLTALMVGAYGNII